MYSLLDLFGNAIFVFTEDGSILDSRNKKIGLVRNGVVCDLDGTPTRVTVEGDKIVWHGVNPGSILEVTGIVIYDISDNDFSAEAIIVGSGGNIAGTTQDQRMIAAAAYWEFVWSKT